MEQNKYLNEFKAKLEKIYNGLITVVDSTYVNGETKCSFNDQEYGQWDAWPRDILRKKTRHPDRLKKEKRKRTVTLEEVQSRLLEVHKDEIIIIPETYTLVSKKATFFDKIQNEQFICNVSWVLNGGTHPKRGLDRANQKKRITKEEFYQRIKENYGDILKVDYNDYKGNKVKIKVIDVEYGEFFATPELLFKKIAKHPKRHEKRGKDIIPIEIIKRDLFIQHGNEVIMVDESYEGKSKKCTFIDVSFGEFTAYVNNVVYCGEKHPMRTVMPLEYVKRIR
jgi:L-fucose mutarotase/ribose pyranase (RbsD/FucU family)